jgi:hypothetical protein
MGVLDERKKMRQIMDETEAARRDLIKSGQPERALEKATQRWNTEQVVEEFEILRFMAPFVVARRKSDGKIGSLEFTHEPRWYFNWTEDPA